MACSSSPCTVTGLTNGQDYSFTVRSRNPVGWSDQSPPSNTVRPDTKPKATSISDVVPGDRKLTVSWTEPPNEGSKVLKYRVQWVNIGGNAGATGQADVPAPALTKVVTGLINDDAYNIRVQAYNEAGWGPFGPDVKAQSFGKPAAVPAPTLSPRSPVPGETNAQVSISWPSTDPNGPAITKYDVFRRTGGGAWNLIATRSGGELPGRERHGALPGADGRLRRDGDQRWSGDVRQDQLPELHGQRLSRQARHHARRHPP